MIHAAAFAADLGRTIPETWLSDHFCSSNACVASTKRFIKTRSMLSSLYEARHAFAVRQENAAAALVDNLAPGMATTHRVAAVTADAVSTRSANTVYVVGHVDSAVLCSKLLVSRF